MAGARPLPSFGDCTAACCYRVAAHGRGLCETHYKTWSSAGSPRAEAFDAWRTRARQPATRRVLSLRGCPNWSAWRSCTPSSVGWLIRSARRRRT